MTIYTFPIIYSQGSQDKLLQVQQTNFMGNLARSEEANTTMFFITEEAKETKLDFFQIEP